MSRAETRRAYLRAALEHARELQESLQAAFIADVGNALSQIGDADRAMRKIGNSLRWAREETIETIHEAKR